MYNGQEKKHDSRMIFLFRIQWENFIKHSNKCQRGLFRIIDTENTILNKHLLK